MTASQEPPLTRREARERERLRQEAAAHAAASPQQVAPPQPIPPTQPVAPPQPVARPLPSAPRQTDAAAPAAWPASSPFAPPRQREHQSAPPAPQGAAPSSAAPAWSPPPAEQHHHSAPPAAPSWPPVERRSAPEPVEPTTPERTLTRRELRAMLDGHSADGLEEYDDLDADQFAAAPPAAPSPVRAPVAAPPRGFEQAPSGGFPRMTPAPHPAEPATRADLPAPIPTRPAVPQVRSDVELDEPATPHKPIGHWTSQLDLPEEPAEPFDQLLSRGGVSRGVPTTTNALILPTLPDHGQLPAPTDGTDIIVTGSIDLPRSFGATGVHPSRIDSSDVDRLFDQVEDVSGSSAAPVSATRAISTQSAARAVMAPPRKDSLNVPLVLAVTAGVLALGVVGTLIVGALAGLF